MKLDPYEIIDKWTSKAPVNIEAMARDFGLEVDKKAELADGISGQLARSKDGSYIVSANGKEHYFRQRFTIAHEIGHFVLHKSEVDKHGGVDDNTKYRSTQDGNFYNTSIDLIHEKQANGFAARVLMPEILVLEFIREFKEENGRPPNLSDLYKKFQVSASAMLWRLKNLELKPGEDYKENAS